MRRASPHVLTAALVLPIGAALAASAMLLVDYVRPLPVFCGEGQGCSVLRQSAWARPLGIPLPAIGLLGFAALAVAALWPGPRARRVHLGLAAAAAVAALGLISLQVVLATFCKFCLVVDVSALAVLAGAYLRFRAEFDPPPLLPRAFGAATVAAAAVVPLGLGVLVPPPPPPPEVDIPAETPLPIRVEMAQTPKGKVTVVDFVDFECPFCRRAHREVHALLEAHPGEVRLVRKHVPLEHAHPHARDAARAAVCAEKLGKGDAMADALFETPVEQLTLDGTAALAAGLGLADDAFRNCFADPSTDTLIDADTLDYRLTQGAGLPTLWFNEERVLGARPREALEEALARAQARLHATPSAAR